MPWCVKCSSFDCGCSSSYSYDLDNCFDCGKLKTLCKCKKSKAKSCPLCDDRGQRWTHLGPMKCGFCGGSGIIPDL